MKLLIFILALFIFVSCNNGYGDKISEKGTSIYYKDGASEEEATVLLDYLVESGFATGEPKFVQLVKDSETGNLDFKMVVDEEVYEGNEYDNVFSIFPVNLSNLFDTLDIDLHLTDDVFETQKVFLNKDAPQSIMALATEIRFTSLVTQEETQKLANYLIKEEFSDNKNPKTILIDKDGDAYLFKMVMADTNVSELIVLNLCQFSVSLSNDVFNKNKVIMHACNDNLNTIKVVECN